MTEIGVQLPEIGVQLPPKPAFNFLRNRRSTSSEKPNYPQFLDAVDDDVAAPWALDLWRSLPTPRAGQRVREVTLTRVLKQHRIRRTDAATLRAPAVKVAPGAVEAAVITHVQTGRRTPRPGQPPARSRAPRARRVGGSTRRGCSGGRPGRVHGGSVVETAARRAILLSVPGIGTKVLATLPAEGRNAVQRRDYEALRCLCGVAPVTRRSGKSLVVTRRLAAHDRLRDAACHWAPRRRPTRSGQPGQVSGATRPAATDTPAPCVRWPTACSTSPARCCATAPASTRTVSGLPLREPDQRPVALGVWMAPGRRSRPEGACGPVRVLRDSGAARRRRPCRQ